MILDSYKSNIHINFPLDKITILGYNITMQNNKLKEIRKKHQLTLQQLSQKTGLSASYLNRIERGLRTPSLYSALRIAQAFNLNVEDIFIHSDKIHKNEDKSKEEKSKNLHRRFKRWISTIISKLR